MSKKLKKGQLSPKGRMELIKIANALVTLTYGKPGSEKRKRLQKEFEAFYDRMIEGVINYHFLTELRKAGKI